MAYRRNPERNIVLTGFYHAGQTAIGRAVARRLHRPFVDVPEELLRRRRTRFAVLSGARRGLLAIDPETRLLQDLCFRRNTIIALDPLCLEGPGNLDDLHVFSYLVFLDPPFEELWQHELIQRQHGRQPNFPERWPSEDEWRVQWQSCRHNYIRADLTLDLQQLDIDMAVRMIQHCFYT